MKIYSRKFKHYVEKNNLKVTEEALEERFQAMLNCVFNDFLDKYKASETFKAIDPVAYRTDFLNYIDALLKDHIIIEYEDGYLDTDSIKELK